MPQLRALIFDLDGVIADTNAPHYLSWQRLSQEEGLAFDAAVYQRMKGLSRADSLCVFLGQRQLDEAAFADWQARKNTYYLEELAHFTPANTFPGVREMIVAGKAAGLRVALASSSQNARLVLHYLGLLDLFDVIGDGKTVARSKPAPDIFHWAAAQVGVQPHEALIFEDSHAGVGAAVAGAFPVICVGPERPPGAFLYVDHFAELHFEAVRQAWTAAQSALP